MLTAGNISRQSLNVLFQILVCLATLTQDNKSAFAYKYSVSDISLIQMFPVLQLIRMFKMVTLHHLLFSNRLDSWGEGK